MSNKIIHQIEKAIFYALSIVIFTFICIEIIELFYQFGKAILASNENSDRLLISKEQTKLVLPVFFNILIAVELFDTLKGYIEEHTIKVQSILLIGLMAIGRKLLVLDLGHSDGLTNIGLASLVLALSLGYYLIKKGDK